MIRFFKGSIFLKNRHFIIQERFNKLIYGINTIIKCGTWQPVKFQLVSGSWNEMILYHISELMLPTSIQRYNKKSFHFDPDQNQEMNWNFTGFQMPHFMILLLLYINLLNISWIKNAYFWGIWSLKENVPKISLNICFLELSEEFPRYSKMSLNWRQ